MPQYFIKKGRKETIENSFKAFLFNRAPLKKKKLRVILFKSMAHITPFVRLKVRKRRRYTKYKLHPAKQDWGRRKALGSFIKVFKGHKPKDFFITLEKELGILQSGKSNIQIKRDEYHKIAWRWAPYKWKKAFYIARKQKKAKLKAKLKAKAYVARKRGRGRILKVKGLAEGLLERFEARKLRRTQICAKIAQQDNTAVRKIAKTEAKKVAQENVSQKRKVGNIFVK